MINLDGLEVAIDNMVNIKINNCAENMRNDLTNMCTERINQALRTSAISIADDMRIGLLNDVMNFVEQHVNEET